MTYRSETDKVRHLVRPFIKGPKILDIGFGGDKVVPEATSMDIPNMYAHTGGDLIDIERSIEQPVLPEHTKQFDTVYSSHLIEDFINTNKIIEKHLDYMKDDGVLILVFPDQRKFVEHCNATGQPLNSHHKHYDMGLKFMLDVMNDKYQVIYTNDCEIDYNCIVVVKKND